MKQKDVEIISEVTGATVQSLINPERQVIISLETALQALSLQREQLRPYLRHLDECGKEMQWPCDCGLDMLIK